MRIQTAIVLLCWFVATVQATPLKLSDHFESPSAFSAALQALIPASDKGEISALFSVKERGQPEDPNTGTLTWPKGIDFCEVLEGEVSDFNDASEWALIWAKAKVPTEGTDSVAAAVFLLKHEKDGWRISDIRRFVASGKYAKVSVKMTSGKPLSFTVEEVQGGRLYCYGVCGSFQCVEGKFKRLDLE